MSVCRARWWSVDGWGGGYDGDWMLGRLQVVQGIIIYFNVDPTLTVGVIRCAGLCL